MFLKRSLGFSVYFLIISIVKIYFEISSDGLGFDDFTGIFFYSGIATLIISSVLLIIEFFISLLKDQEIKFWKQFNFNNSLLVSSVLLLMTLTVYFIIPRIDSKTVILWYGILIVGEILRMFYNKQIFKKK